MSLDKRLAAMTLAGSLALGGCASTAPKSADDLYLQYSNIAANTHVLKEKKKAQGNPFEYTISDIKSAYDAGFIKDFDRDFDNYYGSLTNDTDKLQALATESLLTFPSGINYENIAANNCNLISPGKYSCDIGTVKSGLLDARMGAYVGAMERTKSENWREWSRFSEPLSASIWMIALNYAFASKGGSGAGATCSTVGAGSSTSNVGNTTTTIGGTTSSGTVPVGGTIVDVISNTGGGC